MTILCFSTSGMTAAETPGLLFHLSGDGFTEDYAFGDPEPAYLKEISLISDGPHGTAFHAPSGIDKIITYNAPGNICAQRGTLSFFFRSGLPFGETPFKLFYVSYVLNSCLDMTWLRVDYNGEQGFDAFVTDVNMARVRVRYSPPTFPASDEWIHLALSWDETRGVRLYFNGELAAQKDTTAIFDTGLAYLKPFGRFATPGTATDSCGHIRGCDFDEIVIFDSMLSPEQIRLLTAGTIPTDATAPTRSMSIERYRNEWWHRNGWDKPDQLPVKLDSSSTWSVRKVEIHNVYDQKKWTWRTNDGMRESVWPDAYNRSRLPGRTDYFIEPDWYCYSTSGKKISFTMPDEFWNYVEISGAAYGNAVYEKLDTEHRVYDASDLFTRAKGCERTFHLFDSAYTGGTVIYTNDVQETPMGEFTVFHVTPDMEPLGICTLSYTITNIDEPENNALNEVKDYIKKRFPADERTLMLALPDGAGNQNGFEA
ncbi:MAG: hypothetical protein JXB48_09335 [Candidatus Latescibacteria bacterium]|nr:hypothetical protein [Candidatus Latescibacterota bacterium]